MQDVLKHVPFTYQKGMSLVLARSQQPAAWFRRKKKYAVQMFGFSDRYLPVAIIRSLGSRHPTSP
jgi:hypothetical protein